MNSLYYFLSSDDHFFAQRNGHLPCKHLSSISGFRRVRFQKSDRECGFASNDSGRLRAPFEHPLTLTNQRLGSRYKPIARFSFFNCSPFSSILLSQIQLSPKGRAILFSLQREDFLNDSVFTTNSFSFFLSSFYYARICG